MCSVGDEWVLMAMLLLQCVCGLPVMALMKLCGIAYAVLYSFGFVVSICLTFAPRVRTRCCARFVAVVNDYGLCVFLLTHISLLSLSSYTLYGFLMPFLQSTSSFTTFCIKNKLTDNLTHTGCDKLQALYALSLVALTMANMASAYLLLLGSRITRHNWHANEDRTRLLKNRGSSA